jgi:hypothetical protein
MVLYTPVLSVLSKKKSFVNQNCKINKGAWRYCINDLVTAYAVKVVIFLYDAVLSAKRYGLAIVFFHYLLLYGINYIKEFLFIDILEIHESKSNFLLNWFKADRNLMKTS